MKNNLGVIGIVILAIIVLIVALITYTYVESIRNRPDDEISDFLKGNLFDITEKDTIEYNNDVYRLFEVTLTNPENETRSYDMFFYQLYPPMEQLDYRFYYEKINLQNTTIYRIVRVDMI
jgi:hypothetical protein